MLPERIYVKQEAAYFTYLYIYIKYRKRFFHFWLKSIYCCSGDGDTQKRILKFSESLSRYVRYLFLVLANVVESAFYLDLY